MITSEIETKWKRYVAVIYIPNVFVQTQQTDNEKVIKCLRGRIDQIINIMEPEIYQPYV